MGDERATGGVICCSPGSPAHPIGITKHLVKLLESLGVYVCVRLTSEYALSGMDTGEKTAMQRNDPKGIYLSFKSYIGFTR